jgi:ribosomal protein L37AE/L43A
MAIANAYCKKHDEIEPNWWDFHTDGLWICPKCSRESMKKATTKLIEGMKPLDYALKQIEEKYNEQ